MTCVCVCVWGVVVMDSTPPLSTFDVYGFPPGSPEPHCWSEVMEWRRTHQEVSRNVHRVLCAGSSLKTKGHSARTPSLALAEHSVCSALRLTHFEIAAVGVGTAW